MANVNDEWRNTVSIRTRTVRCGQMEGDISKRTDERHRETDLYTETNSDDRGTECAIEIDGTEMTQTSSEMN